jgi:hypothetical protein
MDKRTTGIVITIAATVLCGCPGIFSLCWGGIAAIVSFVPGADINIGGSSDPAAALWTGVGALCGGLLLIVIPVVVGFFALRNKPETSNNINAM